VAQNMPGAGAAACASEPRLPVVPLRQPRPAEGTQPGQRWQTGREGPDAAPTASFIDSLRGNDAAFEVVVGQGRLLTIKTDIASRKGTAVIAVGDPTVVEFEVLPNPRMIRVIGRRAGVTDLSVTGADGQTYSFEVHVVYDLALLSAQLRQFFPDAEIRLAQLREHLVAEGEARSPAQTDSILRTLEAYLESIQVSQAMQGQNAPFAPIQGGAGPVPNPPPPPRDRSDQAPDPNQPPAGSAPPGENPANPSLVEGPATPGPTGLLGTRAASVKPRIINLIRVPGVHQVLLQVRIAELNRTAMRQIGADFLAVEPHTGNIFGTSIAGSTVSALGVLGLGGLTSAAQGAAGKNTTAFGIFPSSDFELLIRALRQNSLLSILAEPNLVAMSGQRASFLAGGQFPVPVPQSGGGLTNTVTIEFKDFGVQLDFLPYVLEDGTIRLCVTPEVSSIDFALGTTLVQGGDPVPGLNTRRATTTVQLRQGQTLAMAGLLQVEISGQTTRIPGLGDLPYIGPLFSNTSHKRVEKELLVLVTPYLINPMNCDQVPPLPGEELTDPNDLEFYLLNRIEGRTGRNVRSTTTWDDPWHLVRLMRLERHYVAGPVGFSE
jgi:pilus assembly protein CpaC